MTTHPLAALNLRISAPCPSEPWTQVSGGRRGRTARLGPGHLAVLACCDGQHSCQAIADDLGLERADVEDSVSMLVDLGFLVGDEGAHRKVVHRCGGWQLRASASSDPAAPTRPAGRAGAFVRLHAMALDASDWLVPALAAAYVTVTGWR